MFLSFDVHLKIVSVHSNGGAHQIDEQLFPLTIRCATPNGKLTPFICRAVMLFIPSIQASNGHRQTYQPAQKNPIGQAKNIRTRNHAIAHRICFPVILSKKGRTTTSSFAMRLTSGPSESATDFFLPVSRKNMEGEALI